MEVISLSAYLILSISLTIWVSMTLFKNGHIFLVDAFDGNEKMADSVNHLLRVGFYLINLGFIALFLNTSGAPGTVAEVIRQLSLQLGVVMLVLGVTHLLNMKNVAGMRSRALKKKKLETMVSTMSPPQIPNTAPASDW